MRRLSSEGGNNNQVTHPNPIVCDVDSAQYTGMSGMGPLPLLDHPHHVNQTPAGARDPTLVRWTNRPKMSKVERGCAAMFYLSILAQIVMFVLIFSYQNAWIVGPNGMCPSGYVESGEICWYGRQEGNDNLK